jgi:hypothetical protein
LFEGRKDMSIEAMKTALEALDWRFSNADAAIEALRQAIEQAEKWDTSDMAHRYGGLTVDVTDLIQRAIDMERKECAKTYRKIMDDAINRAILREREACAKLCEKQIKSYMSKKYTTDPLGGYRERFASEQCAAAIRGRAE